MNKVLLISAIAIAGFGVSAVKVFYANFRKLQATFGEESMIGPSRQQEFEFAEGFRLAAPPW
jgi:hypothetical protein